MADAAKIEAVRRENAEQAKRARRRRRPSLTSLRIADLNRLFAARYGDTLPNDDAGRDDVAIMAHHLVALPGNAETRIAEWCRLRAPWLAIAELDEITKDALRKPRRWKADRLAWRLRLTDQDRRSLRITTIGAIDAAKASRTSQRKARNRASKEASRRAEGVRPRHEYEAASAARRQPWTALGMSRRTWYRKRRPTA